MTGPYGDPNGLDHHTPTASNYNAVETEFELFYQNILSNNSYIPENELTQLKSKFETYAINTIR